MQGHVDGTREIVSMDVEGDSLWIKVKTPPKILNLLWRRGLLRWTELL